MRADITGADEEWGSLADAVEAMDYESRMRARQLVSDTFERIVIYAKGMRPGTIAKGSSDVILIAKGGAARTLRIDKTGAWQSIEDFKDLSTLPSLAAARKETDH